MSRKGESRRRRKKSRFWRRFLLTAEVLLVGLVLLGGSSVSRNIKAQQKNMEEELPKVISVTEGAASGEEGDMAEEAPVPEAEDRAETPEFSWNNYKTIAHALGGLGGKTYLNSKESFLSAYEKGVRLFEVDLAKTSDNVWVCRHSWNSSLGQWTGEGKQVLSAEKFLSTPLYGKYTPMSFKELVLLLKDYPDAFVLLDSKQYSVRNYQRTIQDYSEYLEIAKAVGGEQVLDQMIPEIYNEAMFPGTALMHQFPSYIYSLWQKYSMKELKHIASFCREKGIPAATMYEKYWSEKAQEIFDAEGILLYVYTVNDSGKAKKYMDSGAAGICTDTLLREGSY